MKELRCLVCGGLVDVRNARGRKSGKPFIMMVCRVSGKHFRAFVTDQQYVKRVVSKTDLDARQETELPTGTGERTGTA